MIGGEGLAFPGSGRGEIGGGLENSTSPSDGAREGQARVNDWHKQLNSEGYKLIMSDHVRTTYLIINYIWKTMGM